MDFSAGFGDIGYSATMERHKMDWPPDIPKTSPLSLHPRGYRSKTGGWWVCGKRPLSEARVIMGNRLSDLLHQPRREQYTDKQLRAMCDQLAENQKEDRQLIIALPAGDEQTVEQLADRFIREIEREAAAREISHGEAQTIIRSIAALLEFVVPDDVPGIAGTSMAKTRIIDLVPDHFAAFATAMRDTGVVRDGGHVVKGKSFARKTCRKVARLFNYANEEDWITRPVKFGKRFKSIAWSKPTPYKSVPPTPDQVRKVLAWLDRRIKALTCKKERDVRPHRQFKAGLLLALNGGYGSRELAQLPVELVDLNHSLIDYERGKTGQSHKVPLWPETVVALRDVLSDRARTRPADPLVFRTREGRCWAYEEAKRDPEGNVLFVNTIDNFNQWWGKIGRRLKLKVANQGFYSFKDLHCTLADEPDESGNVDVHATYKLAGHALPGSRDPYVTVTLPRLRKLVEKIRHHFFPDPQKTPQKTG